MFFLIFTIKNSLKNKIKDDLNHLLFYFFSLNNLERNVFLNLVSQKYDNILWDGWMIFSEKLTNGCELTLLKNKLNILFDQLVQLFFI